jgi:hypothetical protein
MTKEIGITMHQTVVHKINFRAIVGMGYGTNSCAEQQSKKGYKVHVWVSSYIIHP